MHTINITRYLQLKNGMDSCLGAYTVFAGIMIFFPIMQIKIKQLMFGPWPPVLNAGYQYLMKEQEMYHNWILINGHFLELKNIQR